MQELFDAYRKRSTIRTRQAPELPATPRGNETYIADVGNTIHSDVYRYGVTAVITERYEENGYCYYRDTAGVVHRNKDIQKVGV